MKKVMTLALTLSSIFLFSACNNKKQIKDLGIIHEEEFGGVYIKKTIEDFNNYGFNYGDSVDIKFSNGYKLVDQPYYNGYYVDANNSLLVGYPGYDYIKAAINYGDDLFIVASLKETDTATITLNKKGKYKDIQEACDIHYYDERSRYSSDSEFSNFREINVGNIKSGILYRSASPCDNKHNRVAYTDKLIEDAHIEFIMNLADTREKIDGYIEKYDLVHNAPYFLSVYNQDKCFITFNSLDSVDPIGLNMNYLSDDFRNKVSEGCKAMLDSDGPILVHCLEGKDRTGFVCIVLEALMSATYKEIVDDYMKTYDNYYGIVKGDPKYEIIKKRNVDAMLSFICNGSDYTKGDLSSYAKEYLIKGGMSLDEVNSLINILKKKV